MWKISHPGSGHVDSSGHADSRGNTSECQAESAPERTGHQGDPDLDFQSLSWSEIAHAVQTGQIQWDRLPRSVYLELVARGVFEGEHVELLRGALVARSPLSSQHMAVIRRLNKYFINVLGHRVEVHPQGPLAATEDSVPEPDLALIDPISDDRHPATAHLVVEVAQTSLATDRTVKAELYAECGVPEYWIVNLVDDALEVYRDVERGRYRTVTSHGRHEYISLVAFPDVTVTVAYVLGSDRSPDTGPSGCGRRISYRDTWSSRRG